MMKRKISNHESDFWRILPQNDVTFNLNFGLHAQPSYITYWRDLKICLENACITILKIEFLEWPQIVENFRLSLYMIYRFVSISLYISLTCHQKWGWIYSLPFGSNPQWLIYGHTARPIEQINIQKISY